MKTQRQVTQQNEGKYHAMKTAGSKLHSVILIILNEMFDKYDARTL